MKVNETFFGKLLVLRHLQTAADQSESDIVPLRSSFETEGLGDKFKVCKTKGLPLFYFKSQGLKLEFTFT